MAEVVAAALTSHAPLVTGLQNFPYSRISADERAALTAGDITKLYELGANPYLIRRVFRSRFAI